MKKKSTACLSFYNVPELSSQNSIRKGTSPIFPLSLSEGWDTSSYRLLSYEVWAHQHSVSSQSWAKQQSFTGTSLPKHTLSMRSWPRMSQVRTHPAATTAKAYSENLALWSALICYLLSISASRILFTSPCAMHYFTELFLSSSLELISHSKPAYDSSSSDRFLVSQIICSNSMVFTYSQFSFLPSWE